jgi:SOS response regulatory protein OraA/RecX
VVTDQHASAEMRERLARRGIEVRIAERVLAAQTA